MLRVIVGLVLIIAIFGILRPQAEADDVDCEDDAMTLFESNETLAPMTF